MPSDFRPVTQGQADEIAQRRIISGASQDLVPVDVVGGTIVAQVSGQALVTSGGPAPSAGGGLEPTKTPLHVLVTSGSVVGGGGTGISSISGQTVVAKVSGETVVAKVSGETVIAKVSGETVVVGSGLPVVASVSGQDVNVAVWNAAFNTATDVRGGGVDAEAAGLVGLEGNARLYALGSGAYDRLRTMTGISGAVWSGFPLGVLAVGLVSGANAVQVSGATVNAKISGETVRIVYVPTATIADATQSNRLQSMTDNAGNESIQAVGPVIFDGTNFNRIRSWSGAQQAGTGWVGLLAVGVVSGANIVRVSGETVISKVSGETVVAKVSGETLVVSISGNVLSISVSGQPVGVSGATVVASVSGNYIYLAASGGPGITAGSGSLQSGAVPLHVLIISGSVVGGGSTPVNISGQAVTTLVSGQPVGVSGATLVVSVSGNYVYLAASGGPGITAGSGSLQSGAVPLHVLVISGSVAGTGGGTTSGTPVGISGQFTPTSVSGQPVGISGATIVVSVSGQVVSASISGNVVAPIDVSGIRYTTTSGAGVLSGLARQALDVNLIRAPISGETVIAKVSGETLVVSVSGTTILAKVSGETLVVSVSGQVQYIAASGGPIVTAGSGSLQSGAVPLHVLVISGSVVGGGGTSTTNISGQAVTTLVSGQPIVLAVSGPRYPSAGSGMDPSTYPLHVLVVSGSLLAGGASVSVSSGLAVLISGQVVVAQNSGQTVVAQVSGQTLVVSVSGQTIVAAVSGATVIASTSGQVNLIADISGSLITSTSGTGPLSGIAVRAMDVNLVSGETVNAIIQSSMIMVPVDIQNLQSGVIFPTLPTRYIGMSASGGGASVSGSFSPNSSGDEGIWSLSGITSSGAFRAASGQRVPLRVDPVGRLITRGDRVHTIDSGLGVARVYQGLAAGSASGFTMIAAPNSGNYLRVKSLSDSLLSSGIAAEVSYRFGSGGSPFFKHKHLYNPISGVWEVTDEWQMPPGAPPIQGPPNPAPGAFMISYIPLNSFGAISGVGVDRSGVAFTAFIEEVGSGDIY